MPGLLRVLPPSPDPRVMTEFALSSDNPRLWAHLVPRWALPPHRPPQHLYGTTDGEGIERRWAESAPLGPPGPAMGPGTRHASLDDPAITDAKGIERRWAECAPPGPPGRAMGPGTRHASLDDPAILHYSRLLFNARRRHLLLPTGQSAHARSSAILRRIEGQILRAHCAIHALPRPRGTKRPHEDCEEHVLPSRKLLKAA
ncbi:hypothetical protein B0H11DRAFT_2240371 [Mycena galericulata]|nr:hypothetical protein B0H11DRAFT_2240371 [Mycena galericulata]